MKSRENDGGTTVILTEGDLLSDVAETHEDIVTPEIRSTWENPVQFFKSIANRTKIQSFRNYLNAMTSEVRWSLILAETFMPGREAIGGFLWKRPSQVWALISFPTSENVIGLTQTKAWLSYGISQHFMTDLH